MAQSQYAKYISKEIIEESKYPKITAPIVSYHGDRGGRDLAFQWSCITQPLVMDQEPETSDRDQFLLLASTNMDDLRDFRAEIELPLGKDKQRQLISEPAFVYIPAGLVHGPLTVKSVSRPLALWKWTLDAKYSEHWVAADYSNHVVAPRMMDAQPPTPPGGTAPSADLDPRPIVEYRGPGGTPFRYIRTPPIIAYDCFCKPLGIQANLCAGVYGVKYREYCTAEPVHYHTRLDEWLIFLGGDPLNVETFDAHIEMFWGNEQEMQVIDHTCIAHVPPGLIHLGQDVRGVGKPYWHSITVAGTGDYFAEREKVVLSKEEIGEPMIAEGATDWVPATRED